MNYLNYIIYNMQVPSPEPQQVKAWDLTFPLESPSCSIFNTASMPTQPISWAWGAGSCQTGVKSRIKEGQ